jgi:hypothetical protein
MATAVLQDLEGMTPDVYEALNGAMGFPSEVPEGLIAHMAGEIEGGMRVVDIWESRAHFDRFVQQQLGPAMGRVEGADRVKPPTPQEFSLVNEWHR